METSVKMNLHTDAIEQICRSYHVRELAVFGSVLREDFRGDSDVDLLVEFERDAPIGFLALAAMMRELTEVLGRPVDLVTKGGLKPAIRDHVLAEAQVLYAA